jgi:hypothetical protein
MRTFLLSVLALTACGCAPQARVMVLRPAEIDIAGINRLAVVDFLGQGETGREARAAIAAKLAENRHYTLVDQTELSRVEPAAFTGPEPDESRVIQAARHAEVEGLVTGQVVAYEAGEASTLTNPPTVTLAIKLIDVGTGEVRAARQVTRNFRGREVPDRQAKLHELMQGCAAEATGLITPHYEAVDVDLARQYWGNGLTDVRRGNALASDGQWDQAAEAWQLALKDNPQNHVAMHNLAIAAFARGEQAQALAQLDKAIGLYADATYQQNRKLLAAQQKQVQAALAQTTSRRPPVAPAPVEVGEPEPPQILPATGSVIPAALERLPQP